MGSVKLGGALRGGDGIQSGNITSGRRILGNVTILQGNFRRLWSLIRRVGTVATSEDYGDSEELPVEAVSKAGPSSRKKT
jgi:hypothetical protein